MKIKLTRYTFCILIASLALFFSACKKEDDKNQTNNTNTESDDENDSGDGNGTNNPTSDTFIDNRDGTVYKTVTIGDQVWMAENLKYLPSVSSSETYSRTSPHYYVYGYEGTDVTAAKATESYATYGVLYNWVAAMNGEESSHTNPSGVQGICPEGWHLPSNAEWEELQNYLADNGYNYDGTTGGEGMRIAKALADTTHWENSTVAGAVGNSDYPEYRNKSGFSALPAGTFSSVIYFNIGEHAYWWSSTESHEDVSTFFRMRYRSINTQMDISYKEVGFSIRCIKD